MVDATMGNTAPATTIRALLAVHCYPHGLVNEQEALRLRGTATGVLIYQNRNALIEAGNRLGATNLRVFGSVARGDAGPDSDIDILVDLAPTVSLIGLGELEEAFAEILGRKVDVVPASGLKSGIRAAVLKEAIPLEPK